MFGRGSDDFPILGFRVKNIVFSCSTQPPFNVDLIWWVENPNKNTQILVKIHSVNINQKAVLFDFSTIYTYIFPSRWPLPRRSEHSAPAPADKQRVLLVGCTDVNLIKSFGQRKQSCALPPHSTSPYRPPPPSNIDISCYIALWLSIVSPSSSLPSSQ